jgi:hypothetical protein
MPEPSNEELRNSFNHHLEETRATMPGALRKSAGRSEAQRLSLEAREI